jgi:hypothetical protein
MSLSFTERFRHSAGGRTFLYLDVGQDESTTTFTALSVGLTYVDFVGILKWPSIASGPADASVFCGMLAVTVIADGTKIDQGVPLKATSSKHLLLIGW